jgi:hypothetical protein
MVQSSFGGIAFYESSSEQHEALSECELVCDLTSIFFSLVLPHSNLEN